ncbi:aspartate-semialdehyde dehydrogenase [Peloplasma aerotolerans]|uniref:Aspartate-semialdehyde dehydrogenase n=1 Tax=Peloplasma aerotolerans TaxID=3044389 RepID=A0AAW6U3G6_9MOLU|nr:aspartate-semialdehyde dehydrogenase [Mariniplasma sp. M4Ah]MDI6452447.1 aspartate-semialdehyde dehydrogenase [Mariniplasma sp. M4Ah]MDR4968811.1 aspartate-semialdehyde dehydrogenase [Acholeplasmataceae bacterium]
MRKYRVAIVGATGMVGQTFIEVLKERQFPIESISFFASANSHGREIAFDGKIYLIETLTKSSFDRGFDFALFSAGSDISLEYAQIAADQNIIVIDNSSAWRMKPGISLVVPEVNASVLTKNDKIIANPNCSTIQAVVPLKIIDDLFNITRITYSTYQAVSGSGYQGIADLKRGYNNEENLFYDKSIYDNCFPHIDDFLETGYTKEEQKMIDETMKILNKKIKISATCVRIPVTIGHSISVHVECEKAIDLNQLRHAYKENNDIVFYEHNTYPTPKDVVGNDLVHVGRLRKDLSVDHGVILWVVADNIRKGAATNAVQIAEYLIKEDLV